MMRAPTFRYHRAKNVKDAAAALAGEADAMLLAGGTDLVPNMKRRQQTPAMVIGIRHLKALRRMKNGVGVSIGSCVTLTEIAESRKLNAQYTALAKAAGAVATVHLRNMGTLGGNLCLDTRCNYYNQNHEWRQAINYCMKAPASTNGHACATPDGTSICWVATSSPRCWAVSSTDTAPALIALGAEVSLVSEGGERRIPLEQLYHNDGMAYLTKGREELLTSIHLPATTLKSTYWKLRRRGSFDFPVLGVAAAIGFSADKTVESARVVLGAVASYPLLLEESASLVGKPLSEDVIREFADSVTKHARPMDNTDFELGWRKKVVKSYVAEALRELRDAR